MNIDEFMSNIRNAEEFKAATGGSLAWFEGPSPMAGARAAWDGPWANEPHAAETDVCAMIETLVIVRSLQLVEKMIEQSKEITMVR